MSALLYAVSTYIHCTGFAWMEVLFEHLHILTVWQMENMLDLPCMCCADAPKSILSSSNLLSVRVGCCLSAAVLASLGMRSAERGSVVCSGQLDICSPGKNLECYCSCLDLSVEQPACSGKCLNTYFPLDSQTDKSRFRKSPVQLWSPTKPLCLCSRYLLS